MSKLKINWFWLASILGLLCVSGFGWFYTKKMISNRKKVFSLFGPPGAGKGTVTSYLVQQAYGSKLQVISPGNLLRKEIFADTPVGREINSYIKNGGLAPNGLVDKLVFAELLKDHEASIVLLDGYPRTADQIRTLFAFMQQSGSFDYEVIVFDIADEEVVQRLGSRLICSSPSCQKVFSLNLDPTLSEKSLCDHCGSHLTKRSDDGSQAVRSRLEIYGALRQKLLDLYTELGVKISYVQAGQHREVQDVGDSVAQVVLV